MGGELHPLTTLGFADRMIMVVKKSRGSAYSINNLKTKDGKNKTDEFL